MYHLISKFLFHKNYVTYYIKETNNEEQLCRCNLCYITENINNFMFYKLHINKINYNSSSDSSVK
jgi:hypothetical protein